MNGVQPFPSDKTLIYAHVGVVAVAIVSVDLAAYVGNDHRVFGEVRVAVKLGRIAVKIPEALSCSRLRPAEVGFKQFASTTLSKRGRALTKNLGMLTKFPWSELNLRLNGKVLTVPDAITSALKEGVRLRNLIVHTGVAELKGETVDSVLTSVCALLYFLDALRTRQSWPFDHISHEALKDLLPPQNSPSAAPDKQPSKTNQK